MLHTGCYMQIDPRVESKILCWIQEGMVATICGLWLCPRDS